jgi:hypothetical protein
VRVLLDECVDWRLTRHITGHDVKTSRQLGWSSITNGELIALAAMSFDIFVTVDRNLAFQQNIADLPIAVVCSSGKIKSAYRSDPACAPIAASD